MDTPLFSTRVYTFLFSLLGLVYVIGLYPPLMDTDSAHHANIAMHMYLNRDYVNLVDAGQDYLDKPHLLFWLCALSYKIFGVTSFAYRFPSFLFTILGTYSAYRLGKTLYHEETGRLAALILASSFAYMLANEDVRMDAILTACIALATWQGIEFIQHKKLSNAVGLALGLALGFSTKGHIAVVTPAVGLLSYIFYLKDWKMLWNWKWLMVILCFALFISPVVYCYYLQYNLHPEKVVRGRDHINGIAFILFGQSIERFQGDSFGGDAKNDYFFFFHTFLWAFAPWSVLALIALFNRLRCFFKRDEDWLSPATIVIIVLLLSVSGFKLPHYLNVIFPATAVMLASWYLKNRAKEKMIYTTQLILCGLILVLSAVLNAWAFPVYGILLLTTVVLLLAAVFYFFKSPQFSRLQKGVAISVTTIAVLFLLLNANFYPQLLKYQGGNQLARELRGNVDPVNVYFWKDNYASSYNFCTATERKQFDDSIYTKGKKPLWLLFAKKDENEIKQAGYQIGLTYSVPDYEVSRLDLKFVNPATRRARLNELFIGEVTGKQ